MHDNNPHILHPGNYQTCVFHMQHMRFAIWYHFFSFLFLAFAIFNTQWCTTRVAVRLITTSNKCASPGEAYISFFGSSLTSAVSGPIASLH